MSEKAEAYSYRAAVGLPTHDCGTTVGFPVLSYHDRWSAEMNGKMAQVLARLDILDKKVFDPTSGMEESDCLREVNDLAVTEIERLQAKISQMAATIVHLRDQLSVAISAETWQGGTAQFWYGKYQILKGDK